MFQDHLKSQNTHRNIFKWNYYTSSQSGISRNPYGLFCLHLHPQSSHNILLELVSNVEANEVCVGDWVGVREGPGVNVGVIKRAGVRVPVLVNGSDDDHCGAVVGVNVLPAVDRKNVLI